MKRNVLRPVLRYPGGKFAIAPWVVSYLPYHKLYVELYGGAASVLMCKPRSEGEVYNEVDNRIWELFTVLRDKKSAEELTRLLRLTPMSYQEFKHSFDYSDSAIERARMTIFRSFSGIGSDSVFRKDAGFRGLKNKDSCVTAALEWMRYPDCINDVVNRIQGVILENRKALHIIDLYDRPETLFYADPPYVMSTRSRESIIYNYEMEEKDHRELAARLHSVKGKAVISGYNSDLYNELYDGWIKVEKKSQAQNGKKRLECLWLSPNINPRLF